MLVCDLIALSVGLLLMNEEGVLKWIFPLLFKS